MPWEEPESLPFPRVSAQVARTPPCCLLEHREACRRGGHASNPGHSFPGKDGELIFMAYPVTLPETSTRAPQNAIRVP